MTVPARLFILLSRNKEIGVILRRGPAKQVCSIGWDLRDDQFRLGQWLKGRIYERFSDLSPDGERFLYFARGRPRGKVADCWTALSKPPYLTAVGLWNGRWGSGGGLFVGKNRIWLPTGDKKPLRKPPGIEVSDACVFPAPVKSWWLDVYGRRLLRDRWDFRDRLPARSGACFEAPLTPGWVLRKEVHRDSSSDPGGASESHALVETKTGAVLEKPAWEWADCHRGELLWAEGGRLFRGKIGPDGSLKSKALRDFNAMKFEERKAPY